MNDAKQKSEKKKYCGDAKNIGALFQQVDGIFRDMLKTKVGPDDLIIRGGKFQALTSNLEVFLDAWRNGTKFFDWGLWESVSRFDAEYRRGQKKIAPPQDQLVHVERVRLFGEKGDLDLRRDLEHFRWRFIGDPDDKFPSKSSFDPFNIRDYFQHNPNAVFRKLPKRYYLWRKEKKEARVSTMWIGKNGLLLPDADNYLHQTHYFQNGELAFVRFTDICHEAKPENEPEAVSADENKKEVNHVS